MVDQELVHHLVDLVGGHPRRKRRRTGGQGLGGQPPGDPHPGDRVGGLDMGPRVAVRGRRPTYGGRGMVRGTSRVGLTAAWWTGAMARS